MATVSSSKIAEMRDITKIERIGTQFTFTALNTFKVHTRTFVV